MASADYQGWQRWIRSSATGKDENNPDVAKFRDYFDYAEPIRTVGSSPRCKSRYSVALETARRSAAASIRRRSSWSDRGAIGVS